MPDERPGFWADHFDGDLLKVVPKASETLAPIADLALWTHGHITGGRLNHPSVWHGNRGLSAFFYRDPACHLHPPAYYTSDPVVACTMLEAVRDAWSHSYILTVDRFPVWNAFMHSDWSLALTFHVRGMTELCDRHRAEKLRHYVELSLRQCVETVQGLPAPEVIHG